MGKHERRERPRTSPAAVWKEKESIGGKTVDAGVVIMQTSGCSHFHKGGCSMCGYNTDARADITSSDLSQQFANAVKELGEVGMLKVYTSGSFLDTDEMPDEAARAILGHCSEHGIKLLFESRPEYITEGRLDDVLSVHDDLEVAIGLESANDNVLRYSINKGFTVADYDAAAGVLSSKGVAIRTYVLLKPPYLTESEAVRDAIATVKHAASNGGTVSLNPVNVQKGTTVERLWRTWAYRPPWLWSVLEVLKAGSGLPARLVCDPTGGGKERGAHNCGKCDDVVLDGIRAFSLSQDASRIARPECACEDIWRSLVDLEGYVVGGDVDLQRFFRKH